MRIIYLGSPDFSIKPLESIIKSKHQVVGVITQPDKPVGRKGVITPCALKAYAEKAGLNVLTYEKISKDGLSDIKNLNADIMVTCAYGQILSQEILNATKYGVINVHASLLPKFRGPAPIQWAIISGETETGVTIMQTALGVDTGDIILQEKLNILPTETSGELFERLSVLGASLIVRALDGIESGSIVKVKQNESLATKTKMLKKEDGKLNFNLTSIEICNLVRGLNPWPVAYFIYENKAVKVFSCSVCKGTGKCGEILYSDKNNGIVIATFDGAIKINELQLEGSKKMTSEAFLLGRTFSVGYIL